MLQKELAKRLKARYDTKMDGNEWMEVSSDGIPLCRIKYNGQFLSNADQNLSDEYRSKIADIQDEISTVREYVGLYEHAPQMKAADVSDYRQLAAFGDTVLAATYFCRRFNVNISLCINFTVYIYHGLFSVPINADRNIVPFTVCNNSRHRCCLPIQQRGNG